MKKAFIVFFALLPLTFAVAAEPPAKHVPMKRIDNKDIPLEDLAHSFFLDTSRPLEILRTIISEDGVNRLEPEIAEHRRYMNDTRKIAAKLRQSCGDLQTARNGQEFAAVFVEGEEKEQNEREQAARHILSRLDVDDRKALEEHLDTRYRRGSGRSTLEYEAMFVSGPFPSAQTTSITERACESAAEAEARVEPQ